MRPTTHTGGSGERGFILVGVVMFMLALTILGLSLFALSSYEAQFFTTSASREQSLQNAESGMELAKALLVQSPSPQKLEDVRRAVGQFGVTSALAYQWRSGLPEDTTSQGPVNWDSTLVLVVTARSGSVERTLQAQFLPAPTDNPYQQLVTARDSVHINTQHTSNPNVLELRGGVWHPVRSAADTAWTDYVTWSRGRPVKGHAPPSPLADQFVDAKLADPNTQMAPHDFDDEFDLRMTLRNDGTNFVQCFSTPPSPNSANGYSDYDEYSFFTHRDLRITVRGVVVLVAPRGISCRERLIVEAEGSSPATLIIVAKRNGMDPGLQNRGIQFRGGLQSLDNNARVYLVSEGDIGITHRQNEQSDHEVRRLSVLSGGWVELGGPDWGNRFRLTYEPDDMDSWAEVLMGEGALPGLTSGASTVFQPVRPTWTEIAAR